MRTLIAITSIAVACLTGQLLAPTEAAACNCIRAGFELMSPAPSQPAPINTRVRVAFADGWNIPVRIVLRADNGTVVPTTQREYRNLERRVVEAAPRTVLASDTTYEVLAVELGPRRTATVVGRFRTNHNADKRPPAWQGARRARCSSRHPRARVFTPPAVDDVTPASSILYAVWFPGARGRIDTARAPDQLLPMAGGGLDLGASHRCGTTSGRRARLIAVSAVDQSGNTTKPRTMRVSR